MVRDVSAARERQRGLFRAQSLIESHAHLRQINERNILFSGGLAHGFRKIAQRVADLRAVEIPALHGGHQHWKGTPAARFRDEYFQVFPVGGEGLHIGLGPVGLHIVMAELDENVVALFHLAQDFIEAQARDEGLQRFARFRVIRDGNFGFEEARQHLAPAGGGFARLVRYGRVARQENGWHGLGHGGYIKGH